MPVLRLNSIPGQKTCPFDYLGVVSCIFILKTRMRRNLISHQCIIWNRPPDFTTMYFIESALRFYNNVFYIESALRFLEARKSIQVLQMNGKRKKKVDNENPSAGKKE
jgi:hypothetical protein